MIERKNINCKNHNIVRKIIKRKGYNGSKDHIKFRRVIYAN